MNTTTKTTKHRNNLRRAALALAALMLTTATAWAQWSGGYVKVNIEGSGTVTLTHGGTTENFSSNGTSSYFSGDYTITFLPSGGNVVNKVMLKSALSVSGATDITNQLSDIDGGKSYSSSLSLGTDEYTVYFGAQGAASFYTLTSDMQSGGTMTFSVGGETVTTAEEGQRVDITLSDPGSSYYWEVSSLNVSPITQDDATQFHFTMPATDVTVKAEKYMQTTLTYGIIDNSTHGHVNWIGGNWAGNFNGGETATLTVQPDAGYEYVAGTLSATNQSTNEAIALTDCGDGTWTFTMPAASVVVSATFTVISNCYVVHFDKNRDDAFGEMDDQVFTVGVAQELSRCIFSISGIYEFAGWATTADGEAVYYDKQEVTDIAAAGETITLYATWRKPLTYFTVHFDKNSNAAQGVMQDQSFVAGVAKQLFGNCFTREGYAFAGWNLNADGSDSTTYEDEAFFTGSGTDIVLYAQWTSDLAHFSVNNDGSYTIKTATGWSVFCDCLDDNDTYNRFSGKTVKLGADIGTAQDPITRMAGGSSHDFTGTFDGDGKTLTIKYGSAESPHTSRYAAPFLYANDGCTIQNLHVAGEIYTSSTEAAGLIAKQYKTVNIRNCRSSVIIHSTMNGNGTHGGLVGAMYNDNSCQLTIEGCLFDGKILNDGGATTDCSGFVGYKYDNSSLTIRNSLYAPAALGTGEAEPTSNSATFARFDDNSHLTITNCYYTQTLGTAQGKQVLTNAAVQPVGEATATYSVSGLTLYGNGIQCGSTFYYDPERNMLHTVDGYGESTTCGWVFIASPVAESIAPSEVHNLFPSAGETSNEYDLYRFNQSSSNGKEWQNWKQDEGHNNVAPGFSLVNGHGYLYATKETRTLVFAGEYTAATAPVEVPLDYDENAQLKGWNLVGNPFTAQATMTDGNGQPVSFYVINGQNVVPYEGSAATIEPCTGVMVKAEGTGEKVRFTSVSPDQAPQPNKGSLQIALSQVPEPVEGPARNDNVYSGVGVSTSSTTLIDNAIISFNEGSKLSKFYFGTQNANIYIPQDNEEYAIAFSESQGEMPVNFKAETDGTYTISVNVDNVEMGYLHLIDNMTGADIDLLAANGGDARHGDAINRVSTYTFEAKTTDYASRFRLVFSVGVPADGDNEAFAFIDASGNIIVNGMGTLQVIDMTGRVLYTAEANSAFRIQHSAFPTPGVYVLRLINGDDVRTQKIVVE